jgi:hypothetical protein
VARLNEGARPATAIARALGIWINEFNQKVALPTDSIKTGPLLTSTRHLFGGIDEVCQLIREMSVANPLWGAPRIHGELVKLGIDVGQSTVAKYMARRRRPPSQGWKTFLHNHADAIAAIDMFVVPTISFGLLYGLVILRQSRRELLWLGVTAHPNAEWLACQLSEACGWDEPPRYLIRGRDGAYGAAFIRRVAAMGIRDRPQMGPGSPAGLAGGRSD